MLYPTELRAHCEAVLSPIGSGMPQSIFGFGRQDRQRQRKRRDALVGQIGDFLPRRGSMYGFLSRITIMNIPGAIGKFIADPFGIGEHIFLCPGQLAKQFPIFAWHRHFATDLRYSGSTSIFRGLR